MFRRFGQLLRQKLQKVVHFVKKLEKSSIWPKLTTFPANSYVSAFWSTTQEKVAKSDSFREKARKLIDLARTCNFSTKLPCWLISWKSTKNHRFGENLQLFEQTTMCRAFGQLFGKKLQKVADFVKKHENSSIWPKLASFRANYRVSAFLWTFPQKVSKTGSFREEARKIMDFAKTWNFSSKLPCFGVLVNFSAKSCKNWLISWKSTKSHGFGENFQLFEQTTMFGRFGQLFSKTLQNVAHFVKKHDKSLIWPKLGTFRANYNVSQFLSILQGKVSKTGSFR